MRNGTIPEEFSLTGFTRPFTGTEINVADVVLDSNSFVVLTEDDVIVAIPNCDDSIIQEISFTVNDVIGGNIYYMNATEDIIDRQEVCYFYSQFYKYKVPIW